MTKAKIEKSKVSAKIRVEFLTALIKQNKYTQKQLSEKLNAHFVAHTKAANNTILVDSKNVLYCQFDKLVLIDKATKIMSFANYSTKKIEQMSKTAQAEKVAKKELLKKAS